MTGVVQPDVRVLDVAGKEASPGLVLFGVCCMCVVAVGAGDGWLIHPSHAKTLHVLILALNATRRPRIGSYAVLCKFLTCSLALEMLLL